MNILLEKDYELSELQAVAKSIVLLLQQYSGNVLFKGKVGAGKTTLIKALARELAITDEVTSPTFGLVNDYRGAETVIHHFDLYRVNDLDELLNIGWEDYVDSGNWLWVEWPENVPEAFDDSFLLLQIEKMPDENVRSLKLVEM